MLLQTTLQDFGFRHPVHNDRSEYQCLQHQRHTVHHRTTIGVPVAHGSPVAQLPATTVRNLNPNTFTPWYRSSKQPGKPRHDRYDHILRRVPYCLIPHGRYGRNCSRSRTSPPCAPLPPSRTQPWPQPAARSSHTTALLPPAPCGCGCCIARVCGGSSSSLSGSTAAPRWRSPRNQRRWNTWGLGGTRVLSAGWLYRC